MTVASERIQLRDPDPKKKGPRLPKGTSAVLRAALSDRLARAEGWDRSLSPSWYGMAVKLDLEARGEIKRTGSPPRLLRA